VLSPFTVSSLLAYGSIERNEVGKSAGPTGVTIDLLQAAGMVGLRELKCPGMTENCNHTE